MPKKKAIKPSEPKKKAKKRSVLDKIEEAKMTMKSVEKTKKDINKLTEEEYKKDIEARIAKRKKEIEEIFEMVCKGMPTVDIGRKLSVAENYVVDMIRRGKDGALGYWRKMYGV